MREIGGYWEPNISSSTGDTMFSKKTDNNNGFVDLKTYDTVLQQKLFQSLIEKKWVISTCCDYLHS